MNKDKLRHDRNVRAIDFKQNDLVWLYDDIPRSGELKKFTRRWKGPYVVLSQINEVDFVIKPADRRGCKKTVHRQRLKKCFTRSKTSETSILPFVKTEKGVHLTKTTELQIGEKESLNTRDENVNSTNYAEKNKMVQTRSGRLSIPPNRFTFN